MEIIIHFRYHLKAPAKENVIQVMTAERREYSRPKGKFDVQLTMPPPPFNMGSEPFYPEDNFSYGFEPTQEQQWNDNNVSVGWVPSGIKELTPGPMMPPPHMNMSMPPPSKNTTVIFVCFYQKIDNKSNVRIFSIKML